MVVPLPRLLQTPLFDRSGVVAGTSGLNSLVTCINIIDGAYGYKYSQKNMLVLCSAYSIASSTERQVDLLEQIHLRGVVGVAIKPAYFTDNRIPEALLRRADELALPLIALYDSCPSYAEFITFFANHVFLRGTQEITTKNDLLKIFVHEMSQKGIPGLVESIGTRLNKRVSVLFEDEYYAFPHSGEITPFDRALSDCSSVQHFFPAGEDSDLLCYSSRTNGPPVAEEDKLGIPIKTGQNALAYMWVHGGETPCTCDDAAVLDAAVLACELEMIQILTYQQQEAHRRIQFVEHLLAGKLGTVHEAMLMTRGLNWRLPLELRILVIACDAQTIDNQEIELELGELFRTQKKNIIVFPYQDNITVFLPQSDGNELEFYEDLFAHLSKKFGQDKFRFGIGRVNSLKNAHKSFAQAFHALQIGKTVCPDVRIHFFEQLGMYRLFCQEALPEELRLFCEDYVVTLVNMDANAKLDLLKTLETFFSCQQNYSRAGNALYLHPNTVRYRIETIEKICNVDFNNPTDVLNMRIAMKLLPIMGMGSSH